MSIKIPVKNIPYIFFYAWNKYNEGNTLLRNINYDDAPNVPNLFAKLLIYHLNRLIKRGLYKDYVSTSEESSFIKGKINFPLSINNNFQQKLKMFCEFDEMSIDSIPNKIIKKTLLNLLSSEYQFNNKERIKPILRHFEECKASNNVDHYLKQLRLNNSNKYYNLTMKLCEFINNPQIPVDGEQKINFEDFEGYFESENMKQQRGNIFEEFLINFYRIEQDTFKVSGRNYEWKYLESISEGSKSLIPQNELDILLEKENHKLIIDAKFYSDPLKGRNNQQKLIPDHLRQITTYVMNFPLDSKSNQIDAMLLYAQVDKPIKADYEFNLNNSKHKILIRSINLNQEWQKIHADLITLIQVT